VFHLSRPLMSSLSDAKALTFAPSKKVAHLAQDVWSIFSVLSMEHKAVNLGQGFMNFPVPTFVKEAAKRAIEKDAINQYAHAKGNLRLRKALCQSYSSLYGRQLDPEKEVVVTAGANEGIYAALCAFLHEGDEVILFEPFFDQYLPNVTMNGGVPVYVPLRQGKVHPDGTFAASEWHIDMSDLESKVNEKTKVIVVNTPHNPIGKVFSEKELRELGEFARKHHLIILSDEVYDRLVYTPAKHIRIGAMPEYWDYTITVGSIGKTFGVTGWRVGWLIGPEHLIGPSLAAQTRIVFCANHPCQEAAADSLEQAMQTGFFDVQVKEYAQRREKLIAAIHATGLSYTVPDGSYFILVNTSRIQIPGDFHFPEYIANRGKNYMVCYWLCVYIGVTAIPVSEFYSKGHTELATSIVRLAFCKTDEDLQEAAQRLLMLKKYIS